MEQGVAVAVLCIAVGGMAAQWIAWRLRLPAIVLLFAVGLTVGPGLQLLAPTQSFGPSLRPVIGLAVAIIVFEGGLGLDFRELRAAGEGVLRLTALALPLSWVFGAVAAHFLAHMAWGGSLLFGAITVVTGPTVVLPLLRHVRLQARPAAFLKWEAIVNDPVGAILAALVLQVLVSGVSGHLASRLVLGLAVASGLGIGTGFMVRWAFIRDQIPEVLKTPVLLTLALGVSATANLVMDDAGLVAATLLGVTIANLHVPGMGELRRFKEALVVLIVSALFITLTADLSRFTLATLSWPLAGLTAAMLFVVRPMTILLATARSGLSVPERILSGWIAPRGIVAAAVAGVAGLRLQEAGYPGAHEIMPAVFTLIAATMILHGFTLAPLSHRLGLRLGSAPGIAIVGASPWSTDLARALNEASVPVLLIDTFPGALSEARSLGIPVLLAEILSEHGDEKLSGHSVDYLLAATQDEIYNSLVCTRLAPELGRQRVFQLGAATGKLDKKRGLDREMRGRILGDPPIDFGTLERRHEEGWRFQVGQGDGGLVRLGEGGSLHLVTSEEAEASGEDMQVVGQSPIPSALSVSTEAP